jgi:putative ABC transport system permease protein
MNSKLFLLKYSLRNLQRNPKRTIILLLSLAFTTAYVIWVLNFSTSGSREIMKDLLKQYAGRYQITHHEYYLENKKTFNFYKTISDSDLNGMDTSLYSKRISVPILVSGKKKTLGSLMYGLDVTQEKKLSNVHSMVKTGRYLKAGNNKEIVLGKKLAQKIEANIGDQVALIGGAYDGSVANDLFTVVGYLDFGGGDLEESASFTTIESARELTAIPDNNFHQLVNFSQDMENLPKVNLPLKGHSWKDLLVEIFVSMDFMDKFTWIISMILVIVMCLGISNTLMITFLEREKEFLTLNVIGAPNKWVVQSLFYEVGIFGFIAISLGTILGYLLTLYFNANPINLGLFTGGKSIMVGGIAIIPKVRIESVPEYYINAPVMVATFLALSMLYPLLKLTKRNSNAV